jgi:hypothetical protein
MNVIKIIAILGVCVGATAAVGMLYSLGIFYFYIKSNLKTSAASKETPLHY